MVTGNIRLIEYPEKVDLWNCITHAVGAVLSAAGFISLIIKADGIRGMISAVLFGAALILVYTVSAVYHGIKNSSAKIKARLLDHSAIPFLIAGTASPCALITLYEINVPCSIAVFVLAWFCVIFGVVSKVFFFEKLRVVTVTVYIVSCFAMICCALPFLGEIKSEAFGGILLGCVLYLVGGIFCRIGINKPSMHIVFHVFCLLASLVHFLIIYVYVI